MKILLVEDDEATAQLLTECLATYRHIVDTATDGQTGLQLAETYDYDLILLDVVIPKLDGVSVCRQLRASGLSTPILLLTALDSSSDRVLGLEAGADDYLVKPFDLSELVARIRAVLRRSQTAISTGVLTWDKLHLNPTTAQVTWEDKTLHLTPKEYSLLELFLRNPKRIFSRSAILDHIWPSNEFPTEETVTTHIKGLRQKLKAVGMVTDLIETVYGLGYRLRSEPETTPSPTESQTVLDNSPSQESLPSQVQSPMPALDKSLAQAKVLAVLGEIRVQYCANLPKKFAVFEQAIAHLNAGHLDSQLRTQAEVEAHRLAGSLGSFGFPEGSQIARKIELFLKSEKFSKSEAPKLLKSWLDQLKASVKNPPKLPETQPTPTTYEALLLIVDDDLFLAERIKVEAQAWGLQVEIATNLAAARQAIAQYCPDIILLDLSFPDSQDSGLAFLAELRHQNAETPVLIFTEQNQLRERIEVARLGASGFFHKSVSPTELLKAITIALSKPHKEEAKIVLVDDDTDLLKGLQVLLQPWGLQVTPLEDPKQFWDVLETVRPDLIILDVEMPSFSGIELCQAVRNDVRWSHLPILFLSAHSDAETVHQVFAVGADDYVTKPVVGPELISRILNRIERVKMWQKLEEISAYQAKNPQFFNPGFPPRNKEN